MDYAMTGKKGTGKSKNTVRLMRDRYLKKGRRVATNLDVDLEAMFGPRSKITYIRIPDKPTAHDLLAAGHGNDKAPDEEFAGMLALDELGTWLNTRTFGDKDRAGTLDYLAHARKHGWDCWYIMQNIVQVDKQLRESFIEQTVRHTRFDKIKWPFVGGILGLLFGERAAYMPRFHVAVARVGTNPQDLVADRQTFTGKDVEACYDTLQIFDAAYPHGTHTVLSPWHVKGRYMPQAKVGGLAGFLLAVRASFQDRGKPRRRPAPITRPEPAYAAALALVAALPPEHRIAALRVHLAGGASAAPACEERAGAARSAA